MLKLVKLSVEYKDQLVEMIDEWKSYNETTEGANTSPWAIFKNDCHDFEKYLAELEFKEEKDGRVPDSVFFCLDTERNIFVGAVDIRHYLTEELLFTGGHIGDGIRPGERRKGYATEMVALALEECRALGIDKVLMTCDKDNIGSKRSIEKNGGIFENEVIDEEGVPELRYWITL